MSAGWIRKSNEHCYWYACSRCGCEVPKDRYGHDYFSPFCPNCGKEMNGVDEDDYEPFDLCCKVL